MLPEYLAKAKPNLCTARTPWYLNTAPSYAGVFLWVAFYQSMAVGTIDRAPWTVLLLALVIAGLLSYALYYYVPAMLGMKTGYPLYVVGSSTFGTTGGYLMPGLLMGLLQVGWFAVGTFFSTKYILAAMGSDAAPGSATFAGIAIAWGYSMGLIGVLGIQYVAKASLFLNAIPFLMVLVVFFRTSGGSGRTRRREQHRSTVDRHGIQLGRHHDLPGTRPSGANDERDRNGKRSEREALDLSSLRVPRAPAPVYRHHRATLTVRT